MSIFMHAQAVRNRRQNVNNAPIRPEFTWNARLQRHVDNFNAFKFEKMKFYCAICCKLMYQSECKERICETSLHCLPCNEWGLYPIVSSITNKVIVCKDHVRGSEKGPYNYPGPSVTGASKLNYRELSHLSPVKVMSQITRKGSISRGILGHYSLGGSVWSEHNYEFAQMLYSGSLGMTYAREKKGATKINMRKVRDVFARLQAMNPLLQDFALPEVAEQVMQYHLQTNEKHFPGWEMNMLMPVGDVPSNASGVPLNQLIIGQNLIANNDISFAHPSLFALAFPWLFTAGRGHYSMTSDFESFAGLEENQGGVARATLDKETLKGFVKRCLSSADRRFARDPLFLFFSLDAIEKHNIASSNRFVASTRGRVLRQEDVYDNARGSRRKDQTSLVSHVVRSSFAYKRRNYLDLCKMFEAFGNPSLFFTITCDDFAEHVKYAVGDKEPWNDPTLFAIHFKRVWQEFFSHYVLRVFGRQIGGITNWSWVMEIQERGSPHIHCVLWTNKTTEELIDLNVVVATMPTENEDPQLRHLVSRYQQHKCSKYCRPNGALLCRFGYPFQPTTRTHVANGRMVYKRNGDEGYINPYNPFFLKLLEVNMDIQLNIGNRALYYLAKYLTKNVTSGTVSLSLDEQRMQSSKVHFQNRVVGSVEAVYDVMGWAKQKSSVGCVFINTNLPEDDRRQIRSDISLQPSNSTSIFNRSQIEKYVKRPEVLQNLTLPQYYTFYNIGLTTEASEQIFNDHMEMEVDDPLVNPRSLFATMPYYNLPLPVTITDGYNHQYRLRSRIPLWRTKYTQPSAGEAYFYQRIVLSYPSFDYHVEKENAGGSWKSLFFKLVDEGVVENVDDAQREEDVVELFNVEEAEVELNRLYDLASDEQKAIIKTILINSPFSLHVVCGAAGVGKSFILNILYLKLKILGYNVVKLAPTGVAAHNIKGSTIHRFFGMSNRQSVYNTIKLDEYFRTHAKTILLVDECSMISKTLAATMNEALVMTMQRNALLGGVECVFFGDFGQLTPILTDEGRFFESPIFKQATKLVLLKSQRQSDAAFVSILHKVRSLDIDILVKNFLLDRLVSRDNIPLNAVRLYTTNDRVNRGNKKALKKISGPSYHLESQDYFVGSQIAAQLALKETHLLKTLEVKLGVPLMLIDNVDVENGWTNGSICTLLAVSEAGLRVRNVQNNNVKIIKKIRRTVSGTGYSRYQFPFVVAFACTIHKVQSMTLPAVAVHLTSMQSHGQLYVAMSRVKNASDLYFFGVANGHLNQIKLISDNRSMHLVKLLETQ